MANNVPTIERKFVIPAQAGIQRDGMYAPSLDSRLRGNDIDAGMSELWLSHSPMMPAYVPQLTS